jgi:hypothetical protein
MGGRAALAVKSASPAIANTQQGHPEKRRAARLAEGGPREIPQPSQAAALTKEESKVPGLSATAPQKRQGPARPARELAIYDGRDLVAFVREHRAGRFEALTVGRRRGLRKSIGFFDNAREAVAALERAALPVEGSR